VWQISGQNEPNQYRKVDQVNSITQAAGPSNLPVRKNAGEETIAGQSKDYQASQAYRR
jgi:hypothetical protein